MIEGLRGLRPDRDERTFTLDEETGMVELTRALADVGVGVVALAREQTRGTLLPAHRASSRARDGSDRSESSQAFPAGAPSPARGTSLSESLAAVSVACYWELRKLAAQKHSWGGLSAAVIVQLVFLISIEISKVTPGDGPEWIALEKWDVNRSERVVYVRRSFTRGELKIPKTEASMRAVPLQARALDALDRIRDGDGSPLVFGRATAALMIVGFTPMKFDERSHRDGREEEDDG